MNAIKRILVVEDDSLVALDLVQTLESFGYKAYPPVDTGERAVAVTSEMSPDIILMDIRLTGPMDGIEAAHVINSRHPVPIIFITADDEEATLQRAKLSLPYGYLLKPYDSKELRSTIEITLHRINVSSKEAAQADVCSGPGDPENATEHELSASTDRDRVLSKIQLFRDVPPEDCSRFAALFVERRLAAGEYIVNEGRDPKGGFIVLSGRISITKTSFDGKELIVASLPPGGAFGLFYTLKSFSQSSGARCQIESRILWISTKAFEHLLAENLKVAQSFTDELSRYVALSHKLSSSLAHTKVEGRIVASLIALLPQFGRGHPKENQGQIFITRRELAELVGTTGETAIRVTKALERSGLLDLTRPGIIKILDIARLGGSYRVTFV